jgi:hypothetical protein
VVCHRRKIVWKNLIGKNSVGDKKIDSLLNETKGNLFEFLVAKKIAMAFNIEAKFLYGIGPHFLNKLIEYQSITHQNAPDLLHHLNVLSDKVFLEMRPLFENQTVNDVNLVGKINNSPNNSLKNETDVIVTTSEKKYLFSLKLNKAHSLVNTKSGGVKSFIQNYFADFKLSQQDQLEFNYFVEVFFEQFSRELHAYYNTDYQHLFSTWEHSDFPVLPGDLPQDAKPFLYDLYAKLITRLFSYLQHYSIENPSKFANCLLSLIGFSDPDIISIICEHKQNEDKMPQVHKIRIQHYKSFDAQDMVIMPPKAGKSYGEILVKKQFKLQLRIKPMNKFIHPSYKINCAVEFF